MPQKFCGVSLEPEALSLYDVPLVTRRNDKIVLCVDDEQVALSGWCLYLQTKGYQVVGASTPEEGLQVFAVQPVNLVVLDFTMPEMDGKHVATVMKHMKPEVPIILFTGSSGVPDAIHRTVDEQVLKGGEPAELLAKIDFVLGIAEK